MSLFHRHIWLATGVDNLEESSWHRDLQRESLQRIYTIVHQVCDSCGELRTKEVDGKWKLEEIRDIKMNQLKA